MPIYDLEDAIAFINKKTPTTVWCYDCFTKSNGDIEEWNMLTEKEWEEEENKVYVCDKCGKRIER